MKDNALYFWKTNLRTKLCVILYHKIILHDFLVLLMFGNIIDAFTNRSFDLCILNFPLLNSFCPDDVRLSTTNFLNEYQYVKSSLFFESIFSYYLFRKCNFVGLNFTQPKDVFMSKIREQSIWLVSKYYSSIYPKTIRYYLFFYF